MIVRLLLGLGGLVMLAGCGAGVEPVETPVAPSTAAEPSVELLRELGRIGSVFTPRLVLYVAFVLGLALVLRRALTAVVRIAWRLGWDSQRRLARTRSYLELVVLAVTALLLGRVFFVALPVLSLVTVGFVGLLSALALPGGLQDLAAGISLAGRYRFVEGDQVEVDGHEGTVRDIGLLRTMLRLPDGRTLWLPNRQVVRAAVHVGREQQALPVTVPLPENADDPEHRERLRRVAHLSPYRRAGSRPSIVRDGDRWVLSFQTWATRRPEVAAQALSRRLRASRRGTEDLG